MAGGRRFVVRALVALLLVTLTIPGEVLRPDPTAVAAAALAPRQRAAKASPPAAPGTYRSATIPTRVAYWWRVNNRPWQLRSFQN